MDTVDTIVDNLISEASAPETKTTAAPAAAAAPKTPAAEIPGEEGNEPEGAAAEGDEDDSRPWPKKAVNAMSRRDKQLNKYRAQAAENEKRLNDPEFIKQKAKELEQKEAASKPQADPNDPEPDISKYQKWGEYQKALSAWQVRQALKEQNAPKKPPEGTQTPEQKAWTAQRQAAVTQQADEIIKNDPQFLTLLHENADIVDSYPQHVKNALLKSENAPLAFKVLASQGLLEDLGELPAAVAEKWIARAIQQGKASTKAAPQSQEAEVDDQTVSRAPAPLSSARAVGSSSKSLDKMNADEIVKWANT